MKVGLIQIDGKIPNLALMKLASWHRKRGDQPIVIDLSTLGIERWYGSKIFMGGSGYNIKEKLPKEIEEQIPDYELFKTDYSIGFTSRGCFRNCEFCIVKEKEGNLFECDFSKDIKHSKYVVMDNNFLASPMWEEKLKYFRDNNIKVSFTQGLDIRLMTEKKANLLSQVKYYDWKFTKRRLYFAFDDPSIERIFKKKLELLLKYITPRHIMIYMLVGFDTKFSQDMNRFNIITKYGCDPFVMLYHRRNKRLRDFARWVNKRIYKSDSFENYKK